MLHADDLARLATLEELHTDRAVSLAANWPGDETTAFHHAGLVLALRDARTALQVALAAPPLCHWTYSDWDDVWMTGCGHAYQFTSGGPRENQQRFCGYCGALLGTITDSPDRGLAVDAITSAMEAMEREERKA